MKYSPSSRSREISRELSASSLYSKRPLRPNHPRATFGEGADSDVSNSEYGTEEAHVIGLERKIGDGFGGFVDEAKSGSRSWTSPLQR